MLCPIIQTDRLIIRRYKETDIDMQYRFLQVQCRGGFHYRHKRPPAYLQGWDYIKATQMQKNY